MAARDETHPPTPSLLEGENLDSPCPRCPARAGERCRDRAGKERAVHAGRGKKPASAMTQEERNAEFIAEGRAWHKAHLSSLPEVFVIAAWNVERSANGGRPPKASVVRERVRRRLDKLEESERGLS